MDNIMEIKLKHNYYQFEGVFFLWLYLSFDENYAPQNINFLLPDGRKVLAVTESIYLNTNKLEARGVDSIKNTHAGELLQTAYSAPNFKITGSGWNDKLMEHVSQYYSNKQFVDAPLNPFSAEYYKDKTLKKDGIVKILLLRKLEDSEVKNSML